MRYRLSPYGFREKHIYSHVIYGADCADLSTYALKGRCGGFENGHRVRNKDKTRRSIRRFARRAGRMDIQDQMSQMD